jgi:hypothetical protein
MAKPSIASEWRKLELEMKGSCRELKAFDPVYREWMQLRPLMRWCVATGRRPSEMTDDVLWKYVRAMRRPTPTPYHRRVQKLRRAWNLGAQIVPGWPGTLLQLAPPMVDADRAVRRGEHVVTFGEGKFHPSLIDEINRYCANGGFLERATDDAAKGISHLQRMEARLSKLDASTAETLLLSPPSRPRRLAAITLYKHRCVILRTATALHLAGKADLQKLRRIADIVTPAGAAVLADTLAARRAPGSKPSPYAAACVRYLMSISRRCGINLSVAELVALRELSHDLLVDVEVSSELSEKNLKRLLQFDDPRVFAMLVALPDVVMKEREQARARRGGVTKREAAIATIAVAIDILNTLPIRRSTLAALDLKRNFAPPWRRGADGKLIIYGDQEKSEKRLEAPLSARSWRLISLYCRFHRPVLPGAENSTFLFPGLTETGHRWPTQLAKRIARYVKRRLGISINVHLWRHVMGSKLDAKSERADGPARLLGHLPGSKSTKRYVRVQASEAAKRLRKVTDGVRAHGVRQLGFRRHRVRRRRAGGPTAPLSSGGM